MKEACITNLDCHSKAEVYNNEQRFVKYWKLKESAVKVNDNIKLDDRMLIWIKPLDYCEQ